MAKRITALAVLLLLGATFVLWKYLATDDLEKNDPFTLPTDQETIIPPEIHYYMVEKVETKRVSESAPSILPGLRNGQITVTPFTKTLLRQEIKTIKAKTPIFLKIEDDLKSLTINFYDTEKESINQDSIYVSEHEGKKVEGSLEFVRSTTTGLFYSFTPTDPFIREHQYSVNITDKLKDSTGKFKAEPTSIKIENNSFVIVKRTWLDEYKETDSYEEPNRGKVRPVLRNSSAAPIKFAYKAGGLVEDLRSPDCTSNWETITVNPGQSTSLLKYGPINRIQWRATDDLTKNPLNDFKWNFRGSNVCGRTKYIGRDTNRKTQYIIKFIDQKTVPVTFPHTVEASDHFTNGQSSVKARATLYGDGKLKLSLKFKKLLYYGADCETLVTIITEAENRYALISEDTYLDVGDTWIDKTVTYQFPQPFPQSVTSVRINFHN